MLASIIVALLVFPTTIETLTRGKSLGKLAFGLRTVRDDAGPISFHHAFVRALIGVVEIYVFLGGPAFFCALVSSRGKRLGDYAAGTYVVRERVRLQLGAPAPMPPQLAGWAASADLAALPTGLALAVRQFLGRLPQIDPASRAAIGGRLATAVSEYVAPPPPPGTPPEAFLAAVVAARRDRDARPAGARGRAAPPADRAQMSTLRAPGDVLVHLRRARDHADRHYAEPLDLDALAAIAGLSKFHFQRLFKATYGLTPAAYVSERRIERAQDLLRATNLTVTEVCHAVGFSSLGSFSSRFRDLVGETPSEFQRRYAATGAPRIPGCYIFQWGLAERASQEKQEAGDRLLAWPHDHQHRHRVGLRQGRRRLPRLLRRRARLRAQGRHHPRRRLPLVHRQPPQPARARRPPDRPRPAVLRPTWSRRCSGPRTTAACTASA